MQRCNLATTTQKSTKRSFGKDYLTRMDPTIDRAVYDYSGMWVTLSSGETCFLSTQALKRVIELNNQLTEGKNAS